MAILDAEGNPIGKATSSGYTPENMVVVATLVNKISNEPEFSFQVMIPFKQFEFYTENPQHFTLTINNFVGFAYGTKMLGHETQPTDEDLYNWTKEVSDKYSVALSEPLAVDAVFSDASTPEFHRSREGNTEVEERPLEDLN